MTDLLSKGAKLLTDVRSQHMSKEVTYKPLVGAPVTVAACIGMSRFQVETDVPGSFQEVESRDYIVAEGALAFEPRKGDEVWEPAPGGKVRIHVVGSPGDGPAAKWDAHRTCIRIHTKYHRTEDA